MIFRIAPTNRSTNISMVTSGFLDTVNDAVCGGIVASPTGASPALGQLGATLIVNETEAKRRTSGTTKLHAGEYMYVQMKAGTTAAPLAGRLAFWDTNANSGIVNYVVTPDVATAAKYLAGVYINAPTKGNYGFIQISGLANVLSAATIVDNTLGDIAFVEVALTGAVGAADFNTHASITIAQFSSVFGIAYVQPVAGTVTLVALY